MEKTSKNNLIEDFKYQVKNESDSDNPHKILIIRYNDGSRLEIKDNKQIKYLYATATLKNKRLQHIAKFLLKDAESFDFVYEVYVHG